jgi:putative chitinase
MRKEEFITEGPLDYFKNRGLQKQFKQSQQERDKKVDALAKNALKNVAAYISSAVKSGKPTPTPAELSQWAKKYFANFSKDMLNDFEVNSTPQKIDERGLYDWFSQLLNHNFVRLDTIRQQQAQQNIGQEPAQNAGQETGQEPTTAKKRYVKPKYEQIFSDPERLRAAWNAFVDQNGNVTPAMRGVLKDIWMNTGGIRAESAEKKIDEDWKKTAAAFGTGAALALGSQFMKDKNVSPDEWNPPPSRSEIVSPKKDNKVAPPQQNKNVPPLPKNEFRDILIKKATAQGIHGVELAQLLAQAHHETGGYRTMIEDGDNARFTRMYDKAKNYRTARRLGNTTVGDGPKFKGRGHLQITGRDNYTFAAKYLKLPLTSSPDLLGDPNIGADASLWYWVKRVKPYVTDFSDTESVTKRINPGLSGLADRMEQFEYYKQRIVRDDK